MGTREATHLNNKVAIAKSTLIAAGSGISLLVTRCEVSGQAYSQLLYSKLVIVLNAWARIIIIGMATWWKETRKKSCAAASPSCLNGEQVFRLLPPELLPPALLPFTISSHSSAYNLFPFDFHDQNSSSHCPRSLLPRNWTRISRVHYIAYT